MSKQESKPPSGVSYRTVVIQLVVLTLALAVVGVALGYWTQAAAGAWGGLMGAALTGVYFGTTALVMHLGRGGSPPTQIRNLVIAWFIKLVLLLVCFVTLENATWLQPRVFGLSVLVGVFGSLAIEGRAVWSARIGLDPPKQP